MRNGIAYRIAAPGLLLAVTAAFLSGCATGGTDSNNRAVQLCKRGNYAAAEKTATATLNAAEKKYGKSHPAVASAMNSLALVYKNESKYAEAETFYNQALSILEDKLGKEHNLVAATLNNLADSTGVKENS